MKYMQMKAWPTRRIHLFQQGQKMSICSLVFRIQCFLIGSFDFKHQEHRHPYDDLNYCQTCRRLAAKAHGRDYTPITEKYSNIKRRAESKERVRELERLIKERGNR